MLRFQFGEEFGLKTAVVKSPLGTWNGYVGLPSGHPLHGMGEEGLCDLVSVHGGLTWVENHLPTMETDGYWWIGFDTAHAGDLVPALENPPPEVKERRDGLLSIPISCIFNV